LYRDIKSAAQGVPMLKNQIFENPRWRPSAILDFDFGPETSCLLEVVYSRWCMTPKRGVAKVTWPTFEAMGQIPAFHRTYFLFSIAEQWCTDTPGEIFSNFTHDLSDSHVSCNKRISKVLLISCRYFIVPSFTPWQFSEKNLKRSHCSLQNFLAIMSTLTHCTYAVLSTIPHTYWPLRGHRWTLVSAREFNLKSCTLKKRDTDCPAKLRIEPGSSGNQPRQRALAIGLAH